MHNYLIKADLKNYTSVFDFNSIRIHTIQLRNEIYR